MVTKSKSKSKSKSRSKSKPAPKAKSRPAAPAFDAGAVLAKLDEESWNADDIVGALDKAQHAAVRAALLERVADDPTEGLIESLAQFRDDEVCEALAEVLASDEIEHVEAALGALGEFHTKRSRELIAARLDEDEPDIARAAVEALDGKPADLVKLVLPRLDALAAHGDDLLMLAAVEQLVAAAPKQQDVIAALARHALFSMTHDTTLMASNAIFDALIAHAPRAKQAQAAFAAAAAHEDEYAQVRGHAALALTSDAPGPHLAALLAVGATRPSTSSLRKAALAALTKTRAADLAKLAKAGDKAAAKVLGAK